MTNAPIPTTTATKAADAHTAAADVRAASAAVLRMIQGLHISRAVYVAAKLGIADLLADGPRSPAELALLTKAHAPSLYRILRLLAALNVLREQPPGQFALTPLGERLRTGVPGSLHYWAILTDQLGGLRSFDRIFDTVMSGEAGLKLAYNDTWIEFLAKHPAAEANFQAAMSERTAAFAPSVAATYDFARMRRIVDVGGGRGTLLAAVLAARAHLHGVLFDLPEVVAGAAETFQAACVADRCTIDSGDFFVAVPAGGDGYLLANVLHEWDDDRSVAILRNCRTAMHGDGRVLIVERMIFSGADLRRPRRRGLPRRDAVGARPFAGARAKPRGSARVRTPRPPGARPELVVDAEPRALPEAEAAEAGVKLARTARRPSPLPAGARARRQIEAHSRGRRRIAPGSPRLEINEAEHHVMIDLPLAFVSSLRALLSAWPRRPEAWSGAPIRRG